MQSEKLSGVTADRSRIKLKYGDLPLAYPTAFLFFLHLLHRPPLAYPLRSRLCSTTRTSSRSIHPTPAQKTLYKCTLRLAWRWRWGWQQQQQHRDARPSSWAPPPLLLLPAAAAAPHGATPPPQRWPPPPPTAAAPPPPSPRRWPEVGPSLCREVSAACCPCA